MYLNKLLLKDFGKFHNKELELKQGLNLIYGENESGKTTIKEFIIGMLYGIEKTRGLARRPDNYELRKPLDGRGYSGKAYIKHNGKTYLIERSFLKTSKKTELFDVQTGRAENLKNSNTLQGTLFDVDKSTYSDTLCIGENGAAPGKELAGRLNNYLVNMTTTGASDIDKEKAIDYLKAERKKNDTRPLIRRLNELSSRIEEYDGIDEEIQQVGNEIAKLDEEFAMEAAKIKRESRTLIENEDGTVTYKEDESLSENLNKLTETGQDMLRDEEQAEAKLTDRPIVILLTGLFVVLVISVIVHIMPFEDVIRKLFILFTVILVIFTIIDGLIAKGFFESNDISTPSEEEFRKIIKELEAENDEREALKFDLTFARVYADKKTELKLKENELIGKRSECTKLKNEFNAVFKKKGELEKEIAAINIAIAAINDMSTEIHDELGFLINDNISDMVSKITDGKYNEVKLDENLHAVVRDGDGFIGIEYLSAGTMEQIYLAVRLSVAKLLCRDKMPLIIDDIFSSYDEKRLINTLDCLKKIDTEQIILLTSNPHIGDMLDDLDMDYNYVEL